MNWSKPPYGEDYEKLYGITDYKNKTILDIGADYGSTAYFFTQKGAQKIIAVEGDPKLFRLLRINTKNNNKITCIPLFIEKPIHIKVLLKTYKPDITKADIEGWEWTLAEVDDETLKICKEYIIETHSTEIYNKLNNKFTTTGYKLTHKFQYIKRENTDIKICLWKQQNTQTNQNIKLINMP